MSETRVPYGDEKPPRFPGVRDPDFWSIQVDGDEEHLSADTEPEAEEIAAEERRVLLEEWREGEGDEPYLGPTVTVYPVWVGDPRIIKGATIPEDSPGA